MMQDYNYKYYEPLEQMIAVRHQYMSKIIKKITHLNIYEYLKNKKILDIGCGTGEFLKNYHDLNNQCLGIDIQQNFKFKNRIGFTLKNTDFKNTALVLKEELSDNFRRSYSKDSMAQIKLTITKPDQLTYAVKTDTPQFAVFSEMYYPKGWKASIDGKPVAIVNVNYVLRGLPIAAGSSKVEFKFEPEVVKQGTFVRWISLFIFSLVALILGYFQYFKKSN